MPHQDATAAARLLLQAHWMARDYRDCVAAAAALELPPGPAAASHDGSLWAVAAGAVAADFGLLEGERAARAADLVEQGLSGALDPLLDAADAETVLAWCTALTEWCERHGLDAEFARLRARAERADAQAGEALRARVHWRIAAAWHDESFGRFVGVARWLDEAEALARAGGDAALAIVVGLKQARLALARAQPSRALARAQELDARMPPGEAPLWRADLADIRARAALARGDPAAALQQALLCDGQARLARATPAYTITYRLHEAYALLGLGQFDAAVHQLHGLAALTLPAHMQRRVALLARMFGLLRDDAAGGWGPQQQQALHEAVVQLRGLDWLGVLAPLPQLLSRLWARALDAGIEPDWVRASIRAQRLLPPSPGATEAWPWPLKLRVLGSFECQVRGSPVPAGQGRPALKPQELLQHLAAAAGTEPLPLEAVAEALWPGVGREGREKALETTLARLRRALGDADAVWLHDRRLRLNPGRVWVDLDALAILLRQLGPVAATDAAARAAAWRAFAALWRGPLLADAGSDELVPAWLLQSRTRLRQRVAAVLLQSRAADPPELASSRELWAVAADPGLAAWL